MIAIQRSFFDHENIARTKLKNENGQNISSIRFGFNDIVFEINILEEYPITQSFAEYYKEMVCKNPDVEFSKKNLIYFWDNFVDKLIYEEYFNNCFKYIYNVVNLIITNEELSKEEKKAYVERVQALLNKNEMLCYFFNLISFYSRENMTTTYIDNLKEYGFFNDLLRSNKLADIIEKNISNDVKRSFWKKYDNEESALK